MSDIKRKINEALGFKKKQPPIPTTEDFFRSLEKDFEKFQMGIRLLNRKDRGLSLNLLWDKVLEVETLLAEVKSEIDTKK